MCVMYNVSPCTIFLFDKVLSFKITTRLHHNTSFFSDSPVLSRRDHVPDINKSPRCPAHIESHGTTTVHHSHAGADLSSHTHSEANKVPVADESHTQFKIDDVRTHNTDQETITAATQSDTMLTHTNQKTVTTSNSDTMLTHSDQGVIATSNSDTVLTRSDQGVVATSNSDTVLIHSDQGVVATSSSDTMQNIDISDGNVVSIDKEEMPREAVGYHIERLHEDQVVMDDNMLQSTSEIEHSNQDDKVIEDPAENNNTVTKDESVTSNNNKKEEFIISVTSSQDHKVDTITSEKVENVEEEETIRPFLPEQSVISRQQSIVNSDFTSLFKKCIDDMATRREHRKELFGAVSPQPKEIIDHQLKESIEEDKLVAASTTDIWSTVPPCPSKLGAKRIAAAGRILWVMDSKGTTYWHNLENDQWNTEKQGMEYISSSPSGSVVWGLSKGQPYVRKGITKKLPQGQSWHKVDRELMKLIAVGELCAWTVNQDDKLMCRQGVNSVCPEGFQWQYTQFKASFAKSITFYDDVLWACDKMGTMYALNTADSLSHAVWETVNGCLLESMSLTKGGIIWGVEQQLGTLFFRCDVAPVSPCGSGPWWEVSTVQPVNPETSFAGALANKVTSVVPDAISTRIDSFSNRVSNSLPVSFIKNTIGSFIDNNDVIKKISASSEAVWVLDGKGVIRFCCGVVTGSRYVPVSSLEMMIVSLWTQVSAMSTASLNQGGLVWALRSTKELFCFDEGGNVSQIEYPTSKIEQVASSTTAVWIVTNKRVYARDNVTKHNPRGTGWTKVDMGSQNNETVSWLSCGKHVVWLVDSFGNVSMRFGVHSTSVASLALAWIEVDSSCTMTQVVVGTEDWLVWACDTHYNVYVRNGITDTFPIGEKWELVPGCKAINLCTSGNYVWALCPGGELLCRYGVKQDNVMGDYWKCLTGRFCHISATICGQLWGINEKGRLLKRVTHLLTVSESKPQASSPDVKNPEEWDIV